MLEAAYQDKLQELPQEVRVVFFVGLGLWVALAVADPFMNPGHWPPPFWPFRTLGALPGFATLAALYLGFLGSHWRLAMALSAGAPSLAMAAGFWAEHNIAAGGALGFSVVCLVAYAGFSLPTWLASAVCIPAWLVYCTRIWLLRDAFDPGFPVAMVVLSGAGVLTAIGVGLTLERYRRRIFLDDLIIRWERYRSDVLLANVLPASVAGELRMGRHDARRHDSVTVLFADVVGFTPMSATMPADELVQLLDELFVAFDEVAARHGIEKLKTIGDAYMAVSGAPEEREDHAQAMARFALELQEALAGNERLGALQLRIGMHSGPVSAGVIGTKRLAYDIWGDTVNTASRLESHGLPGRIQVSEQTASLLGEGFELEARGAVDLKGKGPTETFFLVGEA